MSKIFIVSPDLLTATGKATEVKGELNGLCNRSACLKPGANWYNHSTRLHYCGACAELINKVDHEWPLSFNSDAIRMFGNELCTVVSLPVIHLSPELQKLVKEGMEIVEGEDFKKGYEIMTDIDEWVIANESSYETTPPEYRRLFAIHIAASPIEGEKGTELDIIHKGINFAQSEQFKLSGESYRSGVGFGYSCGYQDGLKATASQQPEGKEEVEFVEWIRDNRYVWSWDGKKWIEAWNTHSEHTTPELYQLFKQSKTI